MQISALEVWHVNNEENNSQMCSLESGSADENIETMKAYMCKQRGMHLGSKISREEITKKVNQSKYEKYDAVFVYCSCSSATSKNTLVILDFAKWFNYEMDDKRQKRAEGAFEFNEELDGIDVKLILFEQNTDI